MLGKITLTKNNGGGGGASWNLWHNHSNYEFYPNYEFYLSYNCNIIIRR